MNLFRNSRKTEPEPPTILQTVQCSENDALADAKTRAIAAAEKVRQASGYCEELDSQFRTWQLRRDRATKAFYDALAENKAVQDELATLTKPADVRPLGTVAGSVI